MKWEYKILPIEAGGFMGSKSVDEPVLVRKLNALGQEGWELVTAPQAAGSTIILFVFKRSAPSKPGA